MSHRLSTVDLAGVVYSSGKVFEGLATGRLDTENFLRSGSTDGVSSRADLSLLEDLRDAAAFIILHTGRVVDAAFVRQINAQLTRSAALHPGQLRNRSQRIGVNTRYGRHTPPALTAEGLQAIIDTATTDPDPAENAMALFVALAKAQPFEDGNKRTALFAANSLLLTANTSTLLVVPVDEHDPGPADAFNELLASAYIHGDHSGVIDLLRTHGITPFENRRRQSSVSSTTPAPTPREARNTPEGTDPLATPPAEPRNGPTLS